jgi:hypothetical protein
MGEDERIVRVPLPVPLIRRMDELLVRGTAGFHVRADFIREAVEAMVLELSYGPAPEEPAVRVAPRRAPEAADAEHGPADARKGAKPGVGLESTVLHPPRRVVTIGEGVGLVADEPLFGLHNRDYPSIFAAQHLALMTQDEPADLRDFERSVTAAAWEIGEKLLILEKQLGGKFSALFPTNRQKPQSAEEGFRTFAVGTCAAAGADVRLSGPLFLWRVCQVASHDGRLSVALTPDGQKLLNALDGLSLRMPHESDLAERFFEHLRSFAPRDWSGFATVLRAAERGITRSQLIEEFRRAEPDWGRSTCEANASGYVARAREWGLLEPKLAQGRYLLTEFGQQQLS